MVRVVSAPAISRPDRRGDLSVADTEAGRGVRGGAGQVPACVLLAGADAVAAGRAGAAAGWVLGGTGVVCLFRAGGVRAGVGARALLFRTRYPGQRRGRDHRLEPDSGLGPLGTGRIWCGTAGCGLDAGFPVTKLRYAPRLFHWVAPRKIRRTCLMVCSM